MPPPFCPGVDVRDNPAEHPCAQQIAAKKPGPLPCIIWPPRPSEPPCWGVPPPAWGVAFTERSLPPPGPAGSPPPANAETHMQRRPGASFPEWLAALPPVTRGGAAAAFALTVFTALDVVSPYSLLLSRAALLRAEVWRLGTNVLPRTLASAARYPRLCGVCISGGWVGWWVRGWTSTPWGSRAGGRGVGFGVKRWKALEMPSDNPVWGGLHSRLGGWGERGPSLPLGTQTEAWGTFWLKLLLRVWSPNHHTLGGGVSCLPKGQCGQCNPSAGPASHRNEIILIAMQFRPPGIPCTFGGFHARCPHWRCGWPIAPQH